MTRRLSTLFKLAQRPAPVPTEEDRSAEPAVWIKSATFSDDSTVDFKRNDVVIIVGPNNSGKSETLRSISAKAEDSTTRSSVLKRVVLEKEGTTNQVINWLQRTAKAVEDRLGGAFSIFGNTIYERYIPGAWEGSRGSLGGLAAFFFHLLTAGERLQAADPPKSIVLTSEAPAHPIHALQRNDSLEEQLSRQFRKAFGLDIIVHRNAGNEVPVYIGERPKLKESQDRVSYDYTLELEKLPAIHTQGDGMRSFLGILLFAMVGNQTVLLVDEPEAFLHPPQARHLGNVLVTETKPFQQLFVATHSGDVLRGVLDSENSRVRVLRLRRAGEINVTRELDNAQIAKVWGDPLLRYSNILDGLFHEKVVICEADADCRFYSAMSDAIFEARSDDCRKPDIMFTHCGGKSRLPLVMRSLRDLGVPISVVTDFDVLNDEQPLRNIVEAAGGNWSAVLPDWRQVKNAIDGKKPELSADEVKRDIEKALSGNSGTLLAGAVKKEIQSILQRSSPWSIAKSVGLAFVPSGQPSQAGTRLLDSLEALRIFVVPVGELEQFVKSAGNHGPAWTAEVLKMNLKSDPELEPAKQFVAKVIGQDEKK